MSSTAERLRQEALLRAQRRNNSNSCAESSQHGYYYEEDQQQQQQTSYVPNENTFPEQYFSFAPPSVNTTTISSSTTPATGESSQFLNAQQQVQASSSSASSSLFQPNTNFYPPASPNYTNSLLSPAHQQQSPPTTFNNNNPTSHDLAASARSEWRQYGTAKTQALEDKRNNSGGLQVQITAAEDRVDTTGAQYTAYVIRVVHSSGGATNTSPTTSTTTIERRYSEFAKLHAALLSSSWYATQVLEAAPFPAKHWAGRLGNWTPSRIWAPASCQALIDERRHQLDAWLVYLVAATATTLGKQEQNSSTTSVPDALLADFLGLSTSSSSSSSARLPYQQRNDTVEQWRWNNPVTFTLGSSIRQAVRTLQLMTPQPSSASSQSHSNSIPLDLLQAAEGLVFLTVAKAGCVVSGRLGTGLLVAKLPPPLPNSSSSSSHTTTTATPQPQLHSWSAPVALGTVGIGWGAQIGGDVTHYLVVLTTQQAVQDFGRGGGGTVHLGAELDVAVGPAGRSASQQLQKSVSSVVDWTLHSAYAYAHSQGLFVGISLEGSVVTVRKDVNAKFYGRPASAADLLQCHGRSVVTAAEPLYDSLDRALQTEIPKHAFRPSQLWQPQQNDGGGEATATLSTTSRTTTGMPNASSATAAQALANTIENGTGNIHQYYHSG